MSTWTVADLERWDARIQEKVAELGLDCFPQEFEVCDHNQMLGYMAYSGMPSHYPHWSYGKAFEKLKTMYDYGVSGLPYEMVINSNPSLAYLMRDNTLLLQILTIAHVYGHNDFFKNNFTFQTTKSEYVLGMFRAHAARVRAYSEDPSIGPDAVENILDAAHALSLNCRRNLAIKKLTYSEERARQQEAARLSHDPYALIHRREASDEPDPHKIPPAPDEDLLLFIRNYNPRLADWEKDLLTIVHEEAQYFIPQIETKIMNEGWASFVHREIMNRLDLPQDLYLEFLVRHNQVLRPSPGGLNPYHLGLKIWDDLLARSGGPSPEEREHAPLRADDEGMKKLFEVRASDRDSSFLRRFLTPELMQELDLFEYEPRGNDLVISEVSDDAGWQKVKATLLQNVGTGSIPVIKVTDAALGRGGTLTMRHYHDGRDLHLSYAEKTLAYLHRLWGSKVLLETELAGKRALLSYDEDMFTASAAT